MLTKQQCELITQVECNGHYTIRLDNLQPATKEMLGELSIIYGIWLDHITNHYIVAKTGTWRTPNIKCNVRGLGSHNYIIIASTKQKLNNAIRLVKNLVDQLIDEKTNDGEEKLNEQDTELIQALELMLELSKQHLNNDQ